MVKTDEMKTPNENKRTRREKRSKNITQENKSSLKYIKQRRTTEPTRLWRENSRTFVKKQEGWLEKRNDFFVSVCEAG